MSSGFQRAFFHTKNPYENFSSRENRFLRGKNEKGYKMSKRWEVSIRERVPGQNAKILRRVFGVSLFVVGTTIA